MNLFGIVRDLMNLRDRSVYSGKTLDYFVQLTETMNYTQAAEKLGISQPALTQRIKKFEKAIGAPLFYFKGKQMHMTETGHTMLRATKAVYTIFKSVADEIECSTIDAEDHIKVGMLMSIEDQYLVDFFAACHKENPKWKVSLYTLSREDLWRELENDQIDIALLYLPDDTIQDWRAYESINIFKEELLFYQHNEQIIHQETVALKDTVDTMWTAYLPKLYINDLLRGAFIDQNLHLPSVAGYFTTPSQVMNFSRQTGSIAALPSTYLCINGEKEKPYIKSFDPPLYYSLSFVYRKEKMLLPRIERFFHYFDDFFKVKN